MAVFNKNSKTTAAYSPDKLNSIQEGTEIKGDISVISSIRIDGVVHGNITCSAKLVLGKSGHVIGNIISEQAEIEGSVQGEIVIQEKLVLKNSCKIDGNIKTEVLVIEEGASFDGICKMSKNNKPKSDFSQTKDEKTSEDMVY
jgi:cytoskeletal protein CcmA (bactofilin family)